MRLATLLTAVIPLHTMPVSVMERMVSLRLLEQAKKKSLFCPSFLRRPDLEAERPSEPSDLTDKNAPPYCYLFKATVDIDSGYLRVWTVDQEGTPYVTGKLEKGRTIYVRDTGKKKGLHVAYITQFRSSGCAFHLS
jgi:hypothetical protein